MLKKKYLISVVAVKASSGDVAGDQSNRATGVSGQSWRHRDIMGVHGENRHQALAGKQYGGIKEEYGVKTSNVNDGCRVTAFVMARRQDKGGIGEN